MRHFNTAGPVKPEDHYCIPPLNRLDIDEISNLIEGKKYSILHAPRQVGKTSYLLALMEYLNQQGKVRCLYVNVEPAQAARENVEGAMQAILGEFATMAEIFLDDHYPNEIWPDILEISGPFNALKEFFIRWSRKSPLPLVLFIDEIDALVGDTLISVLRQLRAGYTLRPDAFPQSIILCGVRDVRDYRIYSSREKDVR